jgi:prepilin-type N-terminal cleavage/methylation domain-containing protein
MSNKLKKQDGFTLLELVIVIVAIVILAVLVLFFK